MGGVAGERSPPVNLFASWRHRRLPGPARTGIPASQGLASEEGCPRDTRSHMPSARGSSSSH